MAVTVAFSEVRRLCATPQLAPKACWPAHSGPCDESERDRFARPAPLRVRGRAAQRVSFRELIESLVKTLRR
jgi:hypothetical protein